jgi:hypothetical protein
VLRPDPIHEIVVHIRSGQGKNQLFRTYSSGALISSPSKTRLARVSELSYDKFLLHYDWMCQKNLIKEENGSVMVMDEGTKTYNLLVSWILKPVGKLMF